MQVETIENGFLVIPDTNFESDYLAKTFVNNKERKVVVRSGLSVADVMSIKVTTNEAFVVSQDGVIKSLCIALEGLYNHTKNDHCITGLNCAAIEALRKAGNEI